MHGKAISSASLVAALVLSAVAAAATAQDDELGAEDAEPAMETLTGTVVMVPDEDGVAEYLLQLPDGSQVTLDVGPPWYWADAHPLAGLDGQTVTVEGDMGDGVPAERAADIALEGAVGEPDFDVRLIDGEMLWTTMRPPWAGGPAVVGAIHPGYAGWSRGHAASIPGEASDLAPDID